MLEIEQMVSPALLTDKKRSLVDWNPVKAIIKKSVKTPRLERKMGLILAAAHGPLNATSSAPPSLSDDYWHAIYSTKPPLRTVAAPDSVRCDNDMPNCLCDKVCTVPSPLNFNI